MIMKRQGSMSGPLPLFFLVIMLPLIMVSLMGISDALSSEVDESFNDLTSSVDAKAYSDSYFFKYIKRGTEYSVNQQTYELGLEQGGVSWSVENLDLMPAIYNNLGSEVTSHLAENYVASGVEDRNCDIQNPEFAVGLPNPDNLQDGPGISGRVESSNSNIMEECGYSDTSITQDGLDSYYSTRYEASYNRYFQLAREAINYFEDLRGEWRDANDVYTAEDFNCGPPAPVGEVRSRARSQARAAVRGGNPLC